VLIAEDMDELPGHSGENFDAGEFGFGLLETALRGGDVAARTAFAAEFNELAELQRGLGVASAAIHAAAQHIFDREREFGIGSQAGLLAARIGGAQIEAVRAERRVLRECECGRGRQGESLGGDGRRVGFSCGGSDGGAENSSGQRKSAKRTK
jgi:hypothetical protein